MENLIEDKKEGSEENVFEENSKEYKDPKMNLNMKKKILDISSVGNKGVLNRFYKNQIYQSQDYKNLTNSPKKLDENELIIEPHNNNFVSIKKNNYNVNRILTSDDSNKSINNYNYYNHKTHDSFSKNYIGNLVVQNRNIQVNKSPYMKSSVENSVDKGSSSNNYSINQPNLLNNKESYLKKRAIGVRKNLAPKDISQKKILYSKCKDLSQKPQLNLKYNINNSNSLLQNRFRFNKLIKNVTKIQSFWRGAYTRKLMTFFRNLILIRKNIDYILKNHLRDYFHYFLNKLKNYQKPKRKPAILNSKKVIEDQNELKKKIEELNNEILDLNNKLEQEKNLNNKLTEKIKDLENIINKEKEKNSIKNENNINDNYNKDRIIELFEEIKLKDKEIKSLQEQKSRYPFELLEGEKIMSIIISSEDENIQHSIICKNKDIFNKIEDIFYEKYAEYINTNETNIFKLNGKKIDKYKTLEENKIENHSIIILYKTDNYI